MTAAGDGCSAATHTPSERERLFREIAELKRQRNELMRQLAECRQELREYKGDA